MELEISALQLISFGRPFINKSFYLLFADEYSFL
jgi:starvation-inducible outer membrane lipoprotein